MANNTCGVHVPRLYWLYLPGNGVEMSVKLKLSPDLYSYTDNQQLVEVNGNTVDECLYHLTGRFPDLKAVIYTEDGNLTDFIVVYIKGEYSEPWDLFRPVKDGGELSLVLSGG